MCRKSRQIRRRDDEVKEGEARKRRASLTSRQRFMHSTPQQGRWWGLDVLLLLRLPVEDKRWLCGGKPETFLNVEKGSESMFCFDCVSLYAFLLLCVWAVGVGDRRTRVSRDCLGNWLAHHHLNIEQSRRAVLLVIIVKLKRNLWAQFHIKLIWHLRDINSPSFTIHQQAVEEAAGTNHHLLVVHPIQVCLLTAPRCLHHQHRVGGQETDRVLVWWREEISLQYLGY